MNSFTTRSGGFPGIRKKILRRMLPVFLVTIAAGTSISLYKSGNDTYSAMNVIYYYIIGGLILFCWRVYREISKRKKIYETYTLMIDDFSITREQHNTPAITTYIDNVTDIVKNKDGSFIIKGKSASEIIGVPAQMDNYDELERLLNQIKPVTADTKSLRGLKMRAWLTLVGVALMIVVNAVNNKTVVAIAAPVAVVVLGWNFIAVQRNKNVDHTSKKMSWIMLLVIASIIASAYMKLTA